jgi:hypothetical protein
MLRRLIFLAAFFLGSAALIASAQTNTYLIFSSQALCQARAQSQCSSLGCDGVQTRWWWSCVGPLSAGLVGPNAVTSGSYALVVEPGTPFSATTTNAVAPSAVGLSSGEQGKLVTAAAISSVLPAASGGP